MILIWHVFQENNFCISLHSYLKKIVEKLSVQLMRSSFPLVKYTFLARMHNHSAGVQNLYILFKFPHELRVQIKKATVSNCSFVESIGVEPTTSCMPCKRSSQLS